MKIIRIFILTSIFLPTFIAAQDPQWTGKYFHILISTTDFKSAQQVAEAASKKTGLAYRNSDVQPNSTTGITHPSDSCKKWGEEFPCYFPRGRWDDGAYITVEYSSGFEGFAEGYFIVIAASGSNQDVDFTDAVKKVKKFYPKSYVKRTRIWVGCMH